MLLASSVRSRTSEHTSYPSDGWHLAILHKQAESYDLTLLLVNIILCLCVYHVLWFIRSYETSSRWRVEYCAASPYFLTNLIQNDGCGAIQGTIRCNWDTASPHDTGSSHDVGSPSHPTSAQSDGVIDKASANDGNTAGRSNGPKRKRKKSKDDRRDGSDDDHKIESKIHEPASTKPNHNLVCPFSQRYPDISQFDPKNKYRTCTSTSFSDISRLKEHIHRTHISCFRCLQPRDGTSSDGCQILMEEPCTTCQHVPGMSITQDVEDQVKKSKMKGRNVFEKWKKIYRIIFPNSEVPSPIRETPSPHVLLSQNGSIESTTVYSAPFCTFFGCELEKRFRELHLDESLARLLKDETQQTLQRCHAEFSKGLKTLYTEEPTEYPSRHNNNMDEQDFGNFDDAEVSGIYSGLGHSLAGQSMMERTSYAPQPYEPLMADYKPTSWEGRQTPQLASDHLLCTICGSGRRTGPYCEACFLKSQDRTGPFYETTAPSLSGTTEVMDSSSFNDTAAELPHSKQSNNYLAGLLSPSSHFTSRPGNQPGGLSHHTSKTHGNRGIYNQAETSIRLPIFLNNEAASTQQSFLKPMIGIPPESSPQISQSTGISIPTAYTASYNLASNLYAYATPCNDSTVYSSNSASKSSCMTGDCGTCSTCSSRWQPTPSNNSDIQTPMSSFSHADTSYSGTPGNAFTSFDTSFSQFPTGARQCQYTSLGNNLYQQSQSGDSTFGASNAGYDGGHQYPGYYGG